jgi:multiple sugar transport system substrate-binding protein
MTTQRRTRSWRTRAWMGGLVAATVAGMSACTPGTGGSSSGGGDASAAKPKQLHMLYATAEANSAAVQALVPTFKKATGIDLKMDTQPYDALQQKVFSEFASSSPYYDIVIVDTPWAPALVGKLQPLSSYMKNPKLNDLADPQVSDFIPKVFYDTAVYDKKDPVKQFPDRTASPDVNAITSKGFDVYGLPLQANALVMGYRKDMFNDPSQKAAYQKKYGKPLTVPKTLDDYKQVAQFFTHPAQKQYGTTVMAGVGDWATDDFKSLLAAYGGNGHLVGDNLSMDFDSPAGVKALTYYRSLVQAGVVPPGSTSASWDETASSFDSGLTAMTENYHALALDKKVKGQIGYAPVPAGTAQGPHFGTWMLSVNPNSTNKAWAYRAITWLTAAQQQLAMTKNQLHPSRTSVYDKVSNQTKDPAEAEFYTVLGKSLAVGEGRPRLTDYTEVSHEIAVAVNEAASGRKQPKQALDDAATGVRRLLSEAGYKVPSS